MRNDKSNIIGLNGSTVVLMVLFCGFFLVSPMISPASAQEQAAETEASVTAAQTEADAEGTPEPFAHALAPVASFKVVDKANDSGNRIVITWDASPDEATGRVTGYELYRAEKDEPGAYQKISKRTIGLRVGQFEDRRENKIGGHVVENGVTYYYKIAAVGPDNTMAYSEPASAIATSTIFNKRKTNSLLIVVLYVLILVYSIYAARAGISMYIRRLAGIDAIDEAVGRATEMGKPVMYLCGLSDLSDVSTIAAINILSGVARKVANYQSRLILPCRDPMVMTVTQEVVKEAYLMEGRPDAYREDDIYYTTYDQFPYVASVDGIMLREKPATNLYMGYYYAESLILAETGSATGAIQIAGTDAVTQLPFFVTACDYTLLGEELYAASAYISENPLLIGSLKGQDYMKFLIGMFIFLGIIFATLLSINPSWTILQTIIDSIKPLTS